MDSVRNWVLRVELNGEWEECSFGTRKEAVATFVALAKDYSDNLRAAVLVDSHDGQPTNRGVGSLRRPGEWVN